MHLSCLTFIAENISYQEVNAKRVLEVGSQDVNGSVRCIFNLLNPREYIGVDIEKGKGVDVVCPSEKLVEMFGENSFDIVVSTEMLEHVLTWKTAVSNLKRVAKPNGHLFVTTRSYGFGYHAYPYDFWRYEFEDFQEIFDDTQIIKLEKDFKAPGVFLKAVKPENFIERDLSYMSLYATVIGRKVQSLDMESLEFRTKMELILLKQKRKERRKLLKAKRKHLKKQIYEFLHLSKKPCQS